MLRIVSYLRVSTDRQGRSGLGLEAQRKIVADFAADSGGRIVAEFVEVQSGSNDDRPRLAAALAECRRQGARLVLPKLDRLSRRVAFIAALMDSGVDFVAADMPRASRFELHIRASLAEEERRLISERTRNALQAAKRRGVLLGFANPKRDRSTGAKSIHAASAAGVAARRARSEQHALNVLPIVHEIQSAGVITHRGIANALNRRGIVAPRGGRWHPTSVARLLAFGHLVVQAGGGASDRGCPTRR